ncbi:gluconate 2-dehydrogenase subunit 3 family protein [Bradyrhizobium sp. CSA207]|uniref:gluconate 2-dehydrogenase subunit 3 family protein n=1 Tax=Bradyrhizobium sp. CSA207 TaxID=2698826 RepID=UPI0023B087CA|nr:gluconate 2-dehydrogenase subunit 3 family protein [Bradyrhizobium sp. CSA207]MDE5446993.1 gluconate 2-dehydrogenase subunit 3 family protein [Bradyrhizobium sp. CSA207]
MEAEGQSKVLLYLLPHEANFLDAAVERLIPADELGPGAREAGATCYIDRQLSSTWGTHGRNYRAGPWREGAPEQGFQSRLTPQEIYRVGIREVDKHCRTTHGSPFDQLAPRTRDEILRALERNEIQLPSLSSKLFFDILWRNTEEGFFADPMYGGNKDKVGWKLLGFPGMPSGAYVNRIGEAQAYRAEPVSILDYQRGKVRLDAEGFVRHIVIEKEGE